MVPRALLIAGLEMQDADRDQIELLAIMHDVEAALEFTRRRRQQARSRSARVASSEPPPLIDFDAVGPAGEGDWGVLHSGAAASAAACLPARPALGPDLLHDLFNKLDKYLPQDGPAAAAAAAAVPSAAAVSVAADCTAPADATASTNPCAPCAASPAPLGTTARTAPASYEAAASAAPGPAAPAAGTALSFTAPAATTASPATGPEASAATSTAAPAASTSEAPPVTTPSASGRSTTLAEQPHPATLDPSQEEATSVQTSVPQVAPAATLGTDLTPGHSEYSTPSAVVTASIGEMRHNGWQSGGTQPTADSDPFRDLVELALASCRDRPRPPTGALPWRASGEVVEIAGDTAFVGRFWIDASEKTDAKVDRSWRKESADKVCSTTELAARTRTVVYNTAVQTSPEAEVCIPPLHIPKKAPILIEKPVPENVQNRERPQSPERTLVSDSALSPESNHTSETYQTVDATFNDDIIQHSENSHMPENVTAPEAGQNLKSYTFSENFRNLGDVQVLETVQVLPASVENTCLDMECEASSGTLGNIENRVWPKDPDRARELPDNPTSQTSLVEEKENQTEGLEQLVEESHTSAEAETSDRAVLRVAESLPAVTFQGRKYYLDDTSRPPAPSDQGCAGLVQDGYINLSQKIEFICQKDNSDQEDTKREHRSPARGVEEKGVCARLVGAAGDRDRDRLKETNKGTLWQAPPPAPASMGDSLAEVMHPAPATTTPALAPTSAPVAVTVAVQVDSPCPRCGRKAGRAGAPAKCPATPRRPRPRPSVTKEETGTATAAPSSCLQRRKQYVESLETRRHQQSSHSAGAAQAHDLQEDLLILRRLTQTLRTRSSTAPAGAAGAPPGLEILEGLEGLESMGDIINAMLAALPASEGEKVRPAHWPKDRHGDRRELQGRTGAVGRSPRAPRSKVLWSRPSWDPSPQEPPQRFELRPNRSQLRKCPKRNKGSQVAVTAVASAAEDSSLVRCTHIEAIIAKGYDESIFLTCGKTGGETGTPSRAFASNTPRAHPEGTTDTLEGQQKQQQQDDSQEAQVQQAAGEETKVYIHVVGGDADKIVGILSSALALPPAPAACTVAVGASCVGPSVREGLQDKRVATVNRDRGSELRDSDIGGGARLVDEQSPIPDLPATRGAWGDISTPRACQHVDDRQRRGSTFDLTLKVASHASSFEPAAAAPCPARPASIRELAERRAVACVSVPFRRHASGTGWSCWSA
ncbi:Polyadenylate-binding protein, cytoplasmic and nuclear [Frankliniella fusca]|uniref:Polyadenylate-binding protein, cytoplasmic and nuclear n=1 Tax=Frankliniella fusca TaxID=407009 RepID=A0AAE1HZR3_9NEOP|nr:Polyadenylate-binding protein, cytoplasmic and nuclear [Frankliniella fusca]